MRTGEFGMRTPQTTISTGSGILGKTPLLLKNNGSVWMCYPYRSIIQKLFKPGMQQLLNASVICVLN